VSQRLERRVAVAQWARILPGAVVEFTSLTPSLLPRLLSKRSRSRNGYPQEGRCRRV